MSSSVYRRILLSKSSFKRLIFALLEQLNINIQGISSCFLLPSWQICQLHYQAPVLHEVFSLLWVSKHLYTRGIPEQLSRKLISPCWNCDDANNNPFYSLLDPVPKSNLSNRD